MEEIVKWTLYVSIIAAVVGSKAQPPCLSLTIPSLYPRNSALISSFSSMVSQSVMMWWTGLRSQIDSAEVEREQWEREQREALSALETGFVFAMYSLTAMNVLRTCIGLCAQPWLIYHDPFVNKWKTKYIAIIRKVRLFCFTSFQLYKNYIVFF